MKHTCCILALHVLLCCSLCSDVIQGVCILIGISYIPISNIMMMLSYSLLFLVQKTFCALSILIVCES